MKGIFLFEDVVSSTIDNYTIPYSHRRIEYEPQLFQLSDDTDDASLSFSKGRKLVFKTLKEETIQELYLKEDLVGLITYLVRLQDMCKSYGHNLTISILDINYIDAIEEGFHPERLEAITNAYKDEYSSCIINDVVQPYELWLEKLYICISINKTLNMARKAIQEFSGIASKLPFKRNKAKNSYELRYGRLESKLESLYDYLIKEKWIESIDLAKFKSLFQPSEEHEHKVVWLKKIGELKEFILSLQDRFIRDEAIWTTTERRFIIHKIKGDMRGKVGGAKSVKVTRDMKDLKEFVMKLSKLP